jgi:hypothetical protein
MSTDMNLDSLIREHGKPVRNRDGESLLFPDGAQWKHYCFLPPNPDPRLRAMARRRYWEILECRATDEASLLDAALRYSNADPWRYPRSGDWLIEFIGAPTPRTEAGAHEMLSRLVNLANHARQAIAGITQQLGPVTYGSA